MRQSKQTAVSRNQFVRMQNACDRIEDPLRTECKFILHTIGYLDIDKDELVHIREEWIDWRRKTIYIPAQDRCTSGSTGHICEECRSRAKQNFAIEDSLAADAAFADQWRPKSHEGSRSIPFDEYHTTEAVVKQFFDYHSEFLGAHDEVEWYVDRILTAAGLPTETWSSSDLRKSNICL